MGLFGDDDLDRALELVRSTEPRRPGTVSPSADLVAVEGRVRVHRETVDVPLADATVTEIDSTPDDETAESTSGATAEPPEPTSGATAETLDGHTTERHAGETADASPAASGGAADTGGSAGPNTEGGGSAEAAVGTGADGSTADAAGGPATASSAGGEKANAEREPGIDDLTRSEDRGPPVLATYTRRERDGPQVFERRLDAVPFVVEDESGRVLVDVSDLGDDAPGVLLSAGATERLLGTESGDRLVSTGGDSFRQVAAARNAIGTTPEYEHERALLRAGDRVYVLGTARSRAAGEAPGIVVDQGQDADRFVLSDMSRSALAEQLQRASGGLDREFWLFAVVGAIAAIIVLITIAVFVDSFVL